MCIIYREVLRNADFSAHLRLSEILAVAVADDNTFRYVCIQFNCNVQCNIFMYTSTNIPTDSVFHYNFNINKATTIILRIPRIDILLNLFANKLLQKYNKRYNLLSCLCFNIWFHTASGSLHSLSDTSIFNSLLVVWLIFIRVLIIDMCCFINEILRSHGCFNRAFKTHFSKISLSFLY